MLDAETLTRPAVPGPDDIVRQELDNGLIVLARENFSAPSVVVEGLTPTGSIADPADRAGLAAFTASMLNRGTKTRSFSEINELVESLGASITVSGGLHVTNFDAQCLREDFATILDVLTDVLRNPAFPPEHVERVRGQRLTALQERDKNTRARANLAFRTLLYGQDHPYGRESSGTVESVPAIQRQEIEAFYAQNYTARGAILSVVGAIKAEEAVDAVAHALGDWQGAQPRPQSSHDGLTAPKLDDVRTEYVALSGKTQSDIAIGWPGLTRTDPDYYAAHLANTVLGRFGMMGRLGENVREKHGLAYYSYSVLEALRGPGPWMAIAGVNPRNVQKAIDSILEEIVRLQEQLVPEEELSDSQTYLVGSLPLRLETNEGVAGILVDMEWYELGLDYLWRYPDLIQSITPADVQRVARKYLNPQVYALGIAGPPESEPNGQ